MDWLMDSKSRKLRREALKQMTATHDVTAMPHEEISKVIKCPNCGQEYGPLIDWNWELAITTLEELRYIYARHRDGDAYPVYCKKCLHVLLFNLITETLELATLSMKDKVILK